MKELKISSAENGWLLEVIPSEWDFETPGAVDSSVVQSDGDDNEAIGRLLMQVAEWAGAAYDKWGDKNLRVSFDRPGHKVED